MIVSLSLLAALAVFAVGAVIFWSNPGRRVNQAVFSCSVHIAMWLACLHLATTSAQGLFWVRMASAVGGSIPMHFWFVKETIAGGLQSSWRRRQVQFAPWLIVSVGLTVICFTEQFIPSHSTGANRVFGWGYYSYIALDLGLYGFLVADTFRSIRRVAGVRRTELQTWLLGGCTIAGTVLALMALSAITHDSRYIRLQPLMILCFFTATAMAITTYRIFDARQIFLVGSQKLTLVATVTLTAFSLDYVFGLVLPEPFAFFATAAVALWFASILNDWLDRLFHFYPQATAARQAAFAAARNETRIDHLECAFVAVLRGWGQCDRAAILHGTKEALRGGAIELPGDGVVVLAMRQLRWVTPERLVRERPTPERQEVGRFLHEHQLGLLVIGEGPTLTALVGVGVAASRRPFTYPQVTQLMELASIIESALERAHFSVKAQHAEQLATVGLLGASLAHEIRNPLVSIKTFVQLLPTHHHDPAFREKFFRLIGQEVDRIDRLTVQLLELALPRAYQVEKMELHTVLRGSLDLVATKAAEKRIEFRSDFAAAPDVIFSDASAAKQVMLNLCFNAIQAVEAREGERWVRVATRNVPGGIEMAIADSGPGISEEIRPRLFQPFQSTKSTGFGLGLAICSDILGNLDATISVDPAAAGQGATFRVTFPCQPLSS
jgi:signal transduction histidine kinase